jgi:hypothetical protein
MTRGLTLLAAAAVLTVCGAASADNTYFFSCITNNSTSNAELGQTQVSVEVSGVGANATFRFSNMGTEQLAITDVYFQDGTLLGISGITNGPGVNFTYGATPSNLPGGNNIDPPFITTVGFSADALPPIYTNGVGPGEWLDISFSLLPGTTVDDVIYSLNNNTGLRIGLHVQGFVNGGSESFVNLVPAPGTAALGMLGAVLACRRRRR